MSACGCSQLGTAVLVYIYNPDAFMPTYIRVVHPGVTVAFRMMLNGIKMWAPLPAASSFWGALSISVPLTHEFFLTRNKYLLICRKRYRAGHTSLKMAPLLSFVFLLYAVYEVVGTADLVLLTDEAAKVRMGQEEVF